MSNNCSTTPKKVQVQQLTVSTIVFYVHVFMVNSYNADAVGRKKLLPRFY